MGWVKRLADHVIQDRMGHADLEFAWVDLRPADPAEQAKMLDLYVRDGIYTVNEARGILGFDPVAGGDQADGLRHHRRGASRYKRRQRHRQRAWAGSLASAVCSNLSAPTPCARTTSTRTNRVSPRATPTAANG